MLYPDPTNPHRRLGNPSSFDLTKVSFTDDTNYHTVDLSPFSSINATCLMIKLNLQDGAPNSLIKFRHPNETESYAIVDWKTQVANQDLNVSFSIPCLNGQLSIACNPKPSDWSSLNLSVVGWWE